MDRGPRLRDRVHEPHPLRPRGDLDAGTRSSAAARLHGAPRRNDDEAALERGYAKLAKLDEGFSRTVTGNAVNLLASFTPAPAFRLTAAYSWSDNGIEQDMRFGTPSAGKLSYVSPDTTWSGQRRSRTCAPSGTRPRA